MSNARHIQLAGRRVVWRLRASRRAQRLQVSVSYAEGVEVVVPSGHEHHLDAEAFLREQADWVLGRLEEVDRLREQAAPRQYGDGGYFPLFGQSCPLDVKGNRDRPSARYRQGRVELQLADPLDVEVIKSALEALLRFIAREVCESRCRYWARELGVTVGKVRIAGQKTRWGSCSNSGTISFNWRLVLAEPKVLDYVIAHELTHLIHFDHGAGFQATLDRVCPGWRVQEEWLAAKGELLRL
ncbi:MAG: SprT family zinc-dependent metalloprotease [Planctomycetota bacterium]